MVSSNLRLLALVALAALLGVPAIAQQSSIWDQCPRNTGDGTVLHPNPDDPGIKCMHVVAGDGMVHMADDAQKELYIFSFANTANFPSMPAVNGPDYPAWVMAEGILAANAPAPTITVDEDDEVFLNLTNVGMAMRPDLFDPHTIHWHGFPNASSVFDGVPDSSVSINGGATLTYYYNAQDAGTYMWHCHVEAAEHMQMGMLGNLYVRPRQDRLPPGSDLFDAFAANPANIANGGLTAPPRIDTGASHGGGVHYAYNDGDGTTGYDVEVPIQVGSFDPDFHDASFNVQPLPFAGMRDRYFLLNGRGYPDTVVPGVISTQDPLGKVQPSQRVSSLITASVGQRILLRISNLSVTAFYTVGTNGIPMEVVGLDARLLRDGDGNNLYYTTNSVTLGGGQSADVILTPTEAGTYFFYAKNLDKLANDAENFGGMMTEIRVN